MNLFRKAYRAVTFADDDDNTPQGKLGRGCFYVVYWIVGVTLLIFAAQGLEAWWKSARAADLSVPPPGVTAAQMRAANQEQAAKRKMSHKQFERDLLSAPIGKGRLE